MARALGGRPGSCACKANAGVTVHTAMDPADLVSRRMKPVSLLPFLAWLALLAMQLISPDRAWSWPLVGLSVTLLVSYVWARSLRDRVTGARHTLGTWVVAGDVLQERFVLRNDGHLPVLWAEVRDRSEVPGYRVDRVETAGVASEHTWTSTGVCQRRGVFNLGPWQLEMRDPLGLFRVMHYYPTTTTIVVYPRAAHLPHLELPRGRAPGQASSAQRSASETMLVGGIRDYQPGDSLHRVHWPTTARHARLMVREFDREPSGDLWLVVDMDAAVQAGEGGEATQEYAVILAASLASQYVRQGERRGVGLLMAGRRPQYLAPGHGQAQLWRILQALTEAEPDVGTSLENLLAQSGPSLGSGRTVALITPSQDPAWVAPLLPLVGRGNAPAAVLLDATTFSPPNGSADGFIGLRSLLAQQRIPSYVVTQGFPFRSTERIRRVTQKLRALPGTGRVIQVEVAEEV